MFSRDLLRLVKDTELEPRLFLHGMGGDMAQVDAYRYEIANLGAPVMRPTTTTSLQSTRLGTRNGQ